MRRIFLDKCLEAKCRVRDTESDYSLLWTKCSTTWGGDTSFDLLGRLLENKKEHPVYTAQCSGRLFQFMIRYKDLLLK